MAAEAQDARGPAQLRPGIQSDAPVLGVRRAGPVAGGHALGTAEGVRAQPGSWRRRGHVGRAQADPGHRGLVPAVPHTEPGLGLQRLAVTSSLHRRRRRCQVPPLTSRRADNGPVCNEPKIRL